MQLIHDKAVIDQWLARGRILEHFDTPDLNFYGCRYEKGEQLTAPGQPMEQLLFLLEGVIQVYDLRSDGAMSFINEIPSPALVGDLEFCDRGVSQFFAEARTPVFCLGLSTRDHRQALDQDVRFLHLLLESYVAKLRFFSTVDAVAPNLSERLLLYMKTACPTAELHSIETATAQLRCSRRQLQRVLKQLCDAGRIEKIGRGKYRLVAN